MISIGLCIFSLLFCPFPLIFFRQVAEKHVLEGLEVKILIPMYESLVVVLYFLDWDFQLHDIFKQVLQVLYTHLLDWHSWDFRPFLHTLHQSRTIHVEFMHVLKEYLFFIQAAFFNLFRSQLSMFHQLLELSKSNLALLVRIGPNVVSDGSNVPGGARLVEHFG